MPEKKRPGKTGMFVEMPDDLLAKLDALVKAVPLGSKAEHVRLAIQRHIETPPTVEVEPLPPHAVKASPTPAPKPRKRRKS